MTTPDLLNALADVLTALGDAKPYGESYILTEPVAARIVDAGGKIAALLGVSDARFADAAEALRTHATTLTPGLPEGWGWSGAVATNGRDIAGLHDGDFVIAGRPLVPVEVVRAVLARAGVGS
jgi:hypothetical protein